MKNLLFAAFAAVAMLMLPVAASAQGTFNIDNPKYSVADKDNPGKITVDVTGTTATSVVVKKWNTTTSEWDTVSPSDYTPNNVPGGTFDITFDPGIISNGDKIWVKGNTSGQDDHDVTLSGNDWTHDP